jgi:hypothetical protein
MADVLYVISSSSSLLHISQYNLGDFIHLLSNFGSFFLQSFSICMSLKKLPLEMV